MFVFFAYKTFGFGFYDITIAYFDEEIGDVYDDNYLAMASIKKPTFRGENAVELNHSVELWMEEMKYKILPFILEHSTHKSIIESNQFYIPKGGRDSEIIIALLKRKSTELK